MVKYHINPKTGKISLCKATIKCRYGTTVEHYESVNDAQKFIEEYEKNNNKLFATNKKIIHSPITNLKELFTYNEHYYSFSDSLTNSEHMAMEYYTTHGSSFINDYLNGYGAENFEQEKAFNRFIGGIDSFIDKAPKYEKRVYRGVDVDKALGLINGDYKIGDNINFKGYLSSTIDAPIALNFTGAGGVVLIIDTSDGAPPHATNVYGGERPQDFEREIVLPRDGNYKLTNYSLDYFKNKEGVVSRVKTFYLKDLKL